jgi:hypothetical protein
LLKAAWSAYTRSKQKEHRGGRKAKAPAIPENSECANCPNIKCEGCPNRPATPEHLSDCVDPLCGGCR